MKCECEECGGTGKIICHDCAGSGECETTVEDLSLSPKHELFDQIEALKNDLERVNRDCQRLVGLKPVHRDSYESQLREARAEIERIAERLMKGAA